MANTITPTEQPVFADFGGGWIEIFRAGDYGTKGSFTSDDLDRVVSSYDSERHEAPACIGHPKDDLPAYGWVSALSRSGDTLRAKFTQVPAAFEEAVQSGRFKKRSAAFYLDDAGRLSSLRHVAFLGAAPPEVKGLKDINFNDAGRPFTTMEFGEEENVADNKEIRESVMAFFREHMPFLFGEQAQPAVKAFSEADVNQAIETATKGLGEQLAAMQKTLNEQLALFAEREKQQALDENGRRAAAAVSKLKGAGKWIPAFEKMGVSELFSELAKIPTTVEFGEGDTKKQLTPLELMVQFMEGIPQIVPSGRIATPAPQAQGTGTVRFTEGPGTKADQNSIALTDLAKKRANEKNITFGEALDQVVAENPNLTVPGGIHAGAV